MPNTRGTDKNLESVQRKLNFASAKHSDDDEEDDEVVVIEKGEEKEEQTKRSSKKRAAVSTTSSAKRQRGMFQSPTKDRKSTVVVVTPADTSETPKDYVPTHIHKNVEYLRKGEASLSPIKLKVFEWIQDNYEIPQSFENKRAYGPLSGTCFEERVITAYSLGKLKPVVDDSSDSSSTMSCICTACAEIGHKRDECPSLL